MADTTVPVISLAELQQGKRQDELRRCATQQGVFYLSQCGLSEQDHRRAADVAMEVFQHSSAEQRRALTPTLKTTRRGYSPLEAESTATVTNTGQYTDYSMCYSMGLSNNLFPSTRFETIWQDYFRRLYGVAQETARALLMAVDPHSGQDLDKLLDCDPVLRLRYFPEVPEHRVAECEPLRMAPHYDLSIVSLIHQTACANGFVSLRAQIGGETVDLPVMPDTMLVLCGAIATLVTQGAVPAPRHHVAAPPARLRAGSGRNSSVFFLRPSPSFTFSVPEAKKYGLDVCLDTDTATFGEWIGSNYVAMQTPAAELH
ncbi:2OG-Fe(II) oxygenase family protein [Massilia sp. DJPM01]|uniref:2OG-Fe(II) oxygenase family protein n=1 Tax=Massilia sp. DJPM01 TaxID=3024404 RepID=UPI00259D6622|nr:2OG-Fe(II) oxygenase family protein [Massilia sp. DJPM01]MDM5179171.1 2OG-Fe(II) oxygenase family protein [Massilia sp. DJPM01]